MLFPRVDTVPDFMIASVDITFTVVAVSPVLAGMSQRVLKPPVKTMQILSCAKLVFALITGKTYINLYCV